MNEAKPASGCTVEGLVRCIGHGGSGEGCGWVNGKSGGVCQQCGGMLLSPEALCQSELMTERWRKEAANADLERTAT
jgi:hypothetical protein